jgi:hypothetical protein
MPGVKIRHTCDHKVITRTEAELPLRTLRGSGNVDIVYSQGTIKDIVSVSNIDGSSPYVKNIDYRQYGHNRIEWISAIRPVSGNNYIVTIKVSKVEVEEFSLTECPRCGSNGWYVNLIDANTGKFELVSGPEKTVQDYLKLLLTMLEQNRLDSTYGSGLLTVSRGTSSDTNNITSLIGTIVRDCESQLKERQSRKLSKILMSEALSHIEINEITYYEETRKYYLSFKLFTQSNEEAMAVIGI